jgi:hypothetical protein
MATFTRKVTALQIENAYPWVVGGAVFLLAIGAHAAGVSLPSTENFFSAIISLGGVFAGFMATLKAMLFGMDAVTFKRLQDSGYLCDLVNYLSTALWASLVLCGAAIIGFSQVGKYVVLDAGILALVSFALAAIYRVTTISTALFMARKN